ncbi:MAG: hypothetical protein UX51_C0034G0006 [Candidatus Azambacteria bacterium GW2011_GWF2_46_32]|uniref:Uncharacterized protein n=1 Tax=Candidatus Azambacteria bacterium GW2011_GWF2_46_32 TaxID=1618628 RepID=A0A0G1PW10_9BACT|nr:MAG: hypothetical protein UX51_C0034G0006 [Candidatus Azambacteria bacterium GW2011_GWF2_46_32]
MSGTPANAGTNSVGAKSEGAAEGGCGGNSAAPERNKTEASPANPEKNIGSNHILILGEENFLIQYGNPEKALKYGLFLLSLTFKLVYAILATVRNRAMVAR